MHRKKILAVAVAGALGLGSAGVAVAAEAAAGNYTIYGKLYPQVSSYDYSGTTLSDPVGNTLVGPISATADHGQRSTLDVSNSRIGFRGSEGLGGGLSAIFQIETRVRFDTGLSSVWAGGRDSFIGLSSGAGTFKLGNMDTAYKSVGDKMSFLGISSGNFVSHSNVLARGPGEIDFHIRQTNAIMYESPKFAGVQALVTWGKDESKGNPGRSINKLLNSYGVTYDMGPLYLALGHEIHHDFFQGSASFGAVANVAFDANGNPTAPIDGSVRSNDTADRVTVMLKFGDTTLSLDVSQIELKETGGATNGFAGYKNNRYALGAEQKFGNITGAVSVVNSSEGSCTVVGGGPCTTTGLEGRHMNLGGMYSFSRRTQAYAIYSRLTNGRLADYNTVAINPSAGTAPQLGEDVTAIGVGVSHSF
jgi:predicted porin